MRALALGALLGLAWVVTAAVIVVFFLSGNLGVLLSAAFCVASSIYSTMEFRTIRRYDRGDYR